MTDRLHKILYEAIRYAQNHAAAEDHDRRLDAAARQYESAVRDKTNDVATRERVDELERQLQDMTSMYRNEVNQNRSLEMLNVAIRSHIANLPTMSDILAAQTKA